MYIKSLLYFLLFFLIAANCTAQVKIKGNLELTFEQAVQKIPEELRKAFSVWGRDTAMNANVIAKLKIDTLNKRQFRKFSDDIIISDPDTGVPYTANQETDYNGYDILFSHLIKVSDILRIEISDFMGPRTFKHQVVGKRVFNSFEEYYKSDNILMISPEIAATNEMILPVKTSKFFLSTSSFKPGEILYGYAKVSTAVYYRKDSMFSSGYIKTRIRGWYYFKIPIK